MSFKYEPENSRIIHVNDEGQTACRIVRQAELTAECIEEVAEAVVKKMARPEPQREEMLVICDNCGHAIHVKVDIRKPDVLDTNVGEMIYRQAAIDAIHEDAGWLAAQGSDWQTERMERDKSILKSLPSAQPERKKGKWIPVDSFSAFGGDESTWQAHGNPIAFYYCSECKEQAYALEDGTELLSYFCPNCGTDMRKEDNHE